MRYIDADAAKIDAEERGGTLWLTDGDVKEVKRFLDDQPTADVDPVVHAHWKYYKSVKGIKGCFECSACKAAIFEEVFDLMYECGQTRRCGACGARMDEEAKP